MILAVINAIFAIADVGAWKIPSFNWVSTRDLAIPMQLSNQLSYEAIDYEEFSLLDLISTVQYMKDFIFIMETPVKYRVSFPAKTSYLQTWR